ncbi:hypothetical protein ADUPG1_003562, partial [Aduncisulcus paluster]
QRDGDNFYVSLSVLRPGSALHRTDSASNGDLRCLPPEFSDSSGG